MKKLWIVLCVLVALGGVSFGSGNKEAVGAGGDLSGAVLNIAGHVSLQTEVDSKLLKEFEEMTGAKVNFLILPVGEYEKKLTAEWLSKSGAFDIVQYSYAGVRVSLPSRGGSSRWKAI